MSAFRYEAIEASGAPVKGVIEADDRRPALERWASGGCSPRGSSLCRGWRAGAPTSRREHSKAGAGAAGTAGRPEGNHGVHSGDGALLGAAIPIPQALEGSG